MVAYADEATPGNLLRGDNPRKSWMIYWSMEQLPIEMIQREHCWMLGGLIRSSMAQMVEGGMTTIWSAWLRAALPDFADGVTIHHSGGGVSIVVARLGTVISDESALHAMWGSKGSAGLRCCISCRSVVLARSDLHLCSIFSAAPHPASMLRCSWLLLALCHRYQILGHWSGSEYYWEV